MPSVIPTTGTEISMGRIARALGINTNYPPSTAGEYNIKLADTLGTGRGRSLSSVSGFASGSQTKESADFGGLSGSGTY